MPTVKKTVIERGSNIYRWHCTPPRFSFRPYGKNGRRTEKMLKAATMSAAVKEYEKIKNRIAATDFETLAKNYLDAGAPDSRGMSRFGAFSDDEAARIDWLLQFFSGFDGTAIRIPDCMAYKVWRCKRIVKGSGERTCDMELTTLSNVLRYAVLAGQIDSNPIAQGRPKFRISSTIRHCRACSPRSGDELHRLCHTISEHKPERNEALCWQALIEAMTACRTSEILRLRMDAKPGQPGHIEQDKWLHINRSKDGDNPYVAITPELRLCLEAFRRWHKERFPKSHWWFPSFKDNGESTVFEDALTGALRRATSVLHGVDKDKRPLEPRTSHGLRAFYVEWRRSLGESDAKIAGDLGHKTGGARLIWEVYGKKPANWTGGPELSPVPLEVPAFWGKWLPDEKNVLELACA